MALSYHAQEHGDRGIAENREYRQSLQNIWLEDRLLEPMREAIEDGDLASDTDLAHEIAMISCFTDGLGFQILLAEGELEPSSVVTFLDRYLDRVFESSEPKRRRAVTR